MMTPLRFEQLHHDEWSELEIAIGSVGMQTFAKSMSLSPTPGARVSLLYRRACEHLALALLGQCREVAHLGVAEDLHPLRMQVLGEAGERQARLLDARGGDGAMPPTLAGHEGEP